LVGLLGRHQHGLGAHHNDIARWAIGLDGPTALEAKAKPVRAYTAISEYEVTLTWATA
jgi:hypothetical protein